MMKCEITKDTKLIENLDLSPKKNEPKFSTYCNSCGRLR